MVLCSLWDSKLALIFTYTVPPKMDRAGSMGEQKVSNFEQSPWTPSLVCVIFNYGPQLILCATWPRRPAGYNSIPIPHTSKRYQNSFDVRNWNAIVVTSWPARPSCAQNQLRTVLNPSYMYLHSTEQHMGFGTGISVAPPVSVPQTRSS